MRTFILLLFLCTTTLLLSQNTFSEEHSIRETFYSQVLESEKTYQVYLPESYHYSDKTTYPVVYLVDGDYNLLYLTGVVESLSTVGEKIPELIIVAISDNGNEGYKNDCTLKTATNPNGNARLFIDFLEKELKSRIENKFKASEYSILAGHSLGGLFTTNTMIIQPELFSAYIAIDPSCWWDDNAVVTLADSLLENKSSLGAEYFVTLSNVEDMGVVELKDVLKRHFPDSTKWAFKHYPEENHGSVGLLSFRDGLLKIFKDWELDRASFYELSSGQSVIDYYVALSKQYKSTLRLPPNLLSNIIYYFHRKELKEDLASIEKGVQTSFPGSMDDYYANLSSLLVEAQNYDSASVVVEKSIETNPKAYKSWDAKSKLEFAQGNLKKALECAERALQIAKDVKVRQWQLNELNAQIDKVKKSIE